MKYTIKNVSLILNAYFRRAMKYFEALAFLGFVNMTMILVYLMSYFATGRGTFEEVLRNLNPVLLMVQTLPVLLLFAWYIIRDVTYFKKVFSVNRRQFHKDNILHGFKFFGLSTLALIGFGTSSILFPETTLFNVIIIFVIANIILKFIAVVLEIINELGSRRSRGGV